MKYTYCGKSGLQLPRISLGLWHNFGFSEDFRKAKALIQFAFDNGINCFDLANNYGKPAGSAEINFGKIIKQSLNTHRDELIITSKAGYRMWEGPYGDGASRKSLIASLDQSLIRLQLDYVDIFYSHRYDSNTPLEESMQALSDIVRAGKALYIGLSNYPAYIAEKAYSLLKKFGTPCIIQQERYNLLKRDVEQGVLETSKQQGAGFCAFSPLAQGLLSDRYLTGIPDGSRITKSHFLKKEQLTPELMTVLEQLNRMALSRGITLAQLALLWLLHDSRITSVLVGASTTYQLAENIDTLSKPVLSVEEYLNIRDIVEHSPY